MLRALRVPVLRVVVAAAAVTGYHLFVVRAGPVDAAPAAPAADVAALRARVADLLPLAATLPASPAGKDTARRIDSALARLDALRSRPESRAPTRWSPATPRGGGTVVSWTDDQVATLAEILGAIDARAAREARDRRLGSLVRNFAPTLEDERVAEAVRVLATFEDEYESVVSEARREPGVPRLTEEMKARTVAARAAAEAGLRRVLPPDAFQRLKKSLATVPPDPSMLFAPSPASRTR